MNDQHNDAEHVTIEHVRRADGGQPTMQDWVASFVSGSLDLEAKCETESERFAIRLQRLALPIIREECDRVANMQEQKITVEDYCGAVVALCGSIITNCVISQVHKKNPLNKVMFASGIADGVRESIMDGMKRMLDAEFARDFPEAK